jgi:hypothetical protein
MENISAMELHLIGVVAFLAGIRGEGRKVRKKDTQNK